ncbi:putative NTE family protein [Streptomyces hundungensis]|uniref:Putative NTE family protein n=1 Tax=Streptomyces hundungensis TaxID=1077946 RepID=A0A387H6F5_9ACTN|nr:patatin-like phospholipase family protein [Streptomyces hundungensis]AYG78869.1 putative NTE family protein [Streptomyces hundungensis]
MAAADISPTASSEAAPRTAFVLGGGGKLGGYQVGMLRALFERDIVPDLVFGTSVGALQGALLAKNPTPAVCDQLTELWRELLGKRVMAVTVRSVLSNAFRRHPAFASMDALHGVVRSYLGERTRIEDLALPYQCVASSIERAAARYFDSGPLLPAVLASCAIPGLWAPVRIGDEHYVDGGIVETAPVSRAVAYGATTVYVLRMRQRERPLRPARWPWQIGPTVFEISRRHRLAQILSSHPPGVRVHILPSGEAGAEGSDVALRAGPREELALNQRRAAAGYRATCEYLDALDQGRSPHLASSANPVARSYLTTTNATLLSSTASSDRAVTPFLATKYRTLFGLFDKDQDGLIAEADWLGAADNITAAFGHSPDSFRAATLGKAFQESWGRLCEAAGAELSASLDRDTFEGAVARLVGTPHAYLANFLPMVVAFLATADTNGTNMLEAEEAQRLLQTFGVDPADALTVTRRLDTNGDGAVSLDELSEAFQAYFTSDERGCAGNMIFGSLPD